MISSALKIVKKLARAAVLPAVCSMTYRTVGGHDAHKGLAMGEGR